MKEGRAGVESFPVQSGAAAHAYHFEPDDAPAPEARGKEQQTLFSNPNSGRVISFESLRGGGDFRTIGEQRPERAPRAKVERRKTKPRAKISRDQQRLDLLEAEQAPPAPIPQIICNVPVAPAMMRLEAALIDGAIMLAPVALGVAAFFFEGGRIVLNKNTMPFWLVAVFTIPVLYKLLWSWAGRDSVGLSKMGLQLVDFDGNRPSRERRYQRALASFISFFAAGIGLVWALVDEDALAWHDHMSSTFPTISGS